MESIFIGVGSNISPEDNILQAMHELKRSVKVLKSSNFYRTKALNRPWQSDYLNGVFEIESSLSPAALKFELLRKIESKLGRVRSADKFAARTIDLDLLLYKNSIITEENLIIPDPDIFKRDFIAIPLLELKPDLMVPGSKLSLKTIVHKYFKSHLISEKELSLKLKNICEE